MTRPRSDQLTPLPERSLDLLRAVAVLAVFADHLGISAGIDAVEWYGYWAGRGGVLMFFVHTSLVLMASIERGGTGGSWVRTFYTRRAFRIYPLAVVAIVAMLALGIPPVNSHDGIVPPFVMPDWATIAANLALVQNLFGLHKVGVVLWTLPIEVEMYVLLPVCYLVARRKGVVGVVGLLAMAVVTFLLVHYELVRGAWRVRQIARFAPCFLGGVLAYAMLRARHRTGAGPKKVIPPWLWLAALPGGIVIMSAIAPARDWPVPEWIFALVLGGAIPFLRDLPTGKLAVAAHVVARYSYGFYLAHVPAMWAAFVVLRPAHWLIQWAVLAALLVLLPWVGYHAIELPGIRLGSRVTGRRPTLAATAPAP